MRYQRVRLSPDFVGLHNYPSPFDAEPLRVGSGSGSESANPQEIQARTEERGGDLLLKWGHKKRSTVSRAEDDESAVGSRRRLKIQRRAAIAGAVKIAAAAAAASLMAPSCDSVGAHRDPRIIEGRSNGHKRSPPSMNPHSNPQLDHAAGSSEAAPLPEKARQWPRIYVSLSRKEKEDDFMMMKGSKLPQRPKKRPKNIDKSIQYCYPGMWLSDLTRGRYQVREKKCATKKKQRGLKGMESMDSDSE